jgi:cell division protein FtsB
MKKLLERVVPKVRGVLTPVRAVVIVAVVALFWFLVLGDQGIYQFRQLIEMRHRFQAERTKINEEIDTLTKEREMLRNPENLEMIIRSELGYIRPGEILFEEKPAEKK